MTVQLRIPRLIYASTLEALQRSHAFAYERVGFLWGRLGTGAEDEKIVVVSGFEPVDDEDYLNDDTVGARIGPHAIRKALQRAYSHGVGAFHVHVHEHRGTPRFSRTDLRGMDEFVRPFRALAPLQAHGYVVLSQDCAQALAWLPGHKDRSVVRSISVVGFPMTIWGRGAP